MLTENKLNNQSRFIINLKDTGSVALMGGKAFNLSRLTQAGYRVPPGFSITTESYQAFMQFNNISLEDDNLVETINNSPLPSKLETAIIEAYHTYLSNKPCAVRSSSPFEDMKEASFAGQYRSFLNIQTKTDLIEVVKKCWASLWNPDAIAYREKVGLTTDISMAVLVQEFYPATAAGVLFTEDNLIVESVWGLGDILVSGKIVPDHFVVDRSTLKILERKIATKSTKSQPKDTDGKEIIEVAEALKDMPSLSEKSVKHLCALGKRVEKFFGSPQDIEWCLYNDKIVLLQARPITTTKQPLTLRSRANIAETQPGYVDYLSRDNEGKPSEITIAVLRISEAFGLKNLPQDIKMREYIYGHVYINLTNLVSVLGKIPGLSPRLLYRALGHQSEENTQETKLGFFSILQLIPGTIGVIRYFYKQSQKSENIIQESSNFIECIKHTDLTKMKSEKLETLLAKGYQQSAELSQVHIASAMASFILFPMLAKIVKTAEKGAENILTVGLQGMSSRQLGLEMWKLAQCAKKSVKVSELIASRDKNILETLNTFPEGSVFLENFKQFNNKVGDRSAQEMELSMPRWEENPEFVLSMVANYLATDMDLLDLMKAQRLSRQVMTERVEEKLRWPHLRFIFKKLLTQTQHYILLRENMRSAWMRSYSALRIIYLAIADKFVKAGILKKRDDIFHLKTTEVSAIISGTLQKETIDAFIAERKKEKELYKNLNVPETIEGTPLPTEELKYTTVEPKEKLEGMGCSLGVVTGKAKVILNLMEAVVLEKGEILVTHVTDPGWTPLFITAGGLVMELGGTLSHGVVIAREYGLPAVVGVKNATRIIKTGQLITVDGNKGEVYIREEA